MQLVSKRKTSEDSGTGERIARVIGDTARQALRQPDGGDQRPAKRMSSGGVPGATRMSERLSVSRTDGRQAPLHLQVRPRCYCCGLFKLTFIAPMCRSLPVRNPSLCEI